MHSPGVAAVAILAIGTVSHRPRIGYSRGKNFRRQSVDDCLPSVSNGNLAQTDNNGIGGIGAIDLSADNSRSAAAATNPYPNNNRITPTLSVPSFFHHFDTNNLRVASLTGSQ